MGISYEVRDYTKNMIKTSLINSLVLFYYNAVIKLLQKQNQGLKYEFKICKNRPRCKA